MLTIAGGIILAVIIMFVVLPLLWAMIGAVFEGIGSFLESISKAAPFLLGLTVLIIVASNFYSSANFRQGIGISMAILMGTILLYYTASIRLRFTSFSEAFGYLRIRLKPAFSTNAIVSKAEALKGYKAIEDRLRAEADKKRKDIAGRRKNDAEENMEEYLKKAAREYQAHLNIDIIRSDKKRDSIILRVNEKPILEIKYCEAGWSLLDVEASADWHERVPSDFPYLTRGHVIAIARKTLKKELLNSINTAPHMPRN